MHHIIRSLAIAAAAACLAPAASAAVLNFDDLTGTTFFTAPYNGFTFEAYTGTRTNPCPQCRGSWYWSDFNPDPVSYASSGATSISTDYDDALSKDFGNSLAIKSATPFFFSGANFTALDNNIPVQFVMYLGGVFKATSAEVILNYQQPPVFLASGYAGPVDEVQVSSYHAYFAMDDFTYAPVPEPGTWLMLMAGLGAVGLRTARNKRAS